MSAQIVSEIDYQGVRLDDHPEPATPTDWLWRGYLARGWITLLTSQWKAGKTTLLSVLLGRMREGGSLAGRPLSAGRAAVVTEERLNLWRQRGQRLALGSHVIFYSRPFHGLPTHGQWCGLIESLRRLHEREPLDLVVIDPLAAFLPPWSESFATRVMQTLAPLQDLTEAGPAVLLLHHPRKGDPPIGQAARGSGAFAGAAEIVLEMKNLSRPTSYDRRRRLVALSRHEETPRDLIIELNADATDYLAKGDLEEVEFGGVWHILRGHFERAEHKLTRQGILAEWPTPDNKPNEGYLARVLDRAVQQKLIVADGLGHRGKPYRYWLAGREVRPGRLADLPPLESLFPEMLGPVKR